MKKDTGKKRPAKTGKRKVVFDPLFTAPNYLFPKNELKFTKPRVIYILWGIVTAGLGILFIFPFLWMLAATMLPSSLVFAPLKEALAGISFSTASFERAWEIAPFPRYFMNSVLVSAAAVIGQVLISAMAAYSLSKLKPAFYQAALILFLSTFMIPFETIAIPLYLFMRDFSLPGVFSANLINTYWALILPTLANAFNIFIFKTFFDKLPNDFIEASRLDGCSETSIFFRIVMPVSKPIMIVLAILNFVTVWNSFFWPLIVVNEPQMYTLMLGIYKIIEEGQPWNIVMAAVTISMLPTLIIFALFQKQIMRGAVFSGLQE